MNRLLISIIVLLGFCVAKAEGLVCSPDGGLVSFGKFDYVYDSASRLTEVWSNDARVVENKYDALGRRVIKRTPDATHIFVYDGSLLMVERIDWNNGMRLRPSILLAAHRPLADARPDRGRRRVELVCVLRKQLVA